MRKNPREFFREDITKDLVGLYQDVKNFSTFSQDAQIRFYSEQMKKKNQWATENPGSPGKTPLTQCVYINNVCVYINNVCVYINNVCVYINNVCVYINISESSTAEFFDTKIITINNNNK